MPATTEILKMRFGARWALSLAALVALTVGSLVGRHFVSNAPAPSATPPPAINGYVLENPRALSPATLVDDHGAPFSMTDFAGHWSFVYFGYTYCPDVCPLSLLELAAVKKRLLARMPDVAVTYYFVSVDPARDTPERLHSYVAYFDSDFRGLTGSIPELTQFATETGSLFLIPEGQDKDSYLITHSSNMTVLDPTGKLAAVITPPHEPENIATDFAKIVAYRSDLSGLEAGSRAPKAIAKSYASR